MSEEPKDLIQSLKEVLVKKYVFAAIILGLVSYYLIAQNDPRAQIAGYLCLIIFLHELLFISIKIHNQIHESFDKLSKSDPLLASIILGIFGIYIIENPGWLF